eukprot:scaffold647795_cov45-Prasinocladus_malaysianus.AAC.1
MDESLYDEFGNYIGPELSDSEGGSEAGSEPASEGGGEDSDEDMEGRLAWSARDVQPAPSH